MPSPTATRERCALPLGATLFLIACTSATLEDPGSQSNGTILDDDDYGDPPVLPGESPTPAATQHPTPLSTRRPSPPPGATPISSPTPVPHESPADTHAPSPSPSAPPPQTSPPACTVTLNIAHPEGEVDGEGPLWILFYADAESDQTPQPTESGTPTENPSSDDPLPVHQLSVNPPYRFPVTVSTTLLAQGDVHADVRLDSDNDGTVGDGDCQAQTDTFSTASCPVAFDLLLRCDATGARETAGSVQPRRPPITRHPASEKSLLSQ